MKRLSNRLIYATASTLRKLGVHFNEEQNELVLEMQRIITALDEHAIQFKTEVAPDGTWSAESTNIDGIMTGGKDPRHIPEMIKDAVFTYFEIPPKLCRDELLRSDNEPAKVEQRVHVGA
ncbi:MAG TPA: hypothetical protein VLF90_01850 [Patescibacteria group bacterium]|nr:hypothetical protein [Patescibacteria group bacterium]